jgi:2'-hydroxyisoflavone reductase
LKILVLGGTVFVGRALVEVAVARGHEITLFHRGQHNVERPDTVATIHGDRDGGLAPLAGGRWDAVLDVCGYFPRIVRQSAELLASRADLYVFISTLSVYRDFAVRHLDEDYPLAELEDPSVEKIEPKTYGGLKVLCERVVEQAVPGRSLIIRPGLIVGPNDPTDRFTYWPARMARGGEVLAPGDPQGELQFIDVRDLAEWVVSMVEEGSAGAYNATGRGAPVTFERLLEECGKAAGQEAAVTWVAESFLLEQKVAPWIDLPLWLPCKPEFAGFSSVRIERALNRGLGFRPLAETVRDVLAWNAARPADRQPAAGLDPAREQELLRRWHESNPC